MSKKTKKIIIALIIVVIIVIAIVAFVLMKSKGTKNNGNNTAGTSGNTANEQYVQMLDDGTKLNTSSKLGEAKKVGDLTFENLQLTAEGGQTILLADVTNTGKKATDTVLVDIKLLDENGNEIVTVGGIVQPLEAGAKTQFNTSMTLDYANAYDFEVTEKE